MKWNAWHRVDCQHSDKRLNTQEVENEFNTFVHIFFIKLAFVKAVNRHTVILQERKKNKKETEVEENDYEGLIVLFVAGSSYDLPEIDSILNTIIFSTKSSISHISVVHKTAPQYLQERVSRYNPPRSFCSSSRCRLSISDFGKNTNKKHSGAMSFCNAAPTLWNRLPDKLHQAKDVASFQCQRKSHLFSTLWSPHPITHVFLPLSSYPLPPKFSILCAKCNKHVVSLYGVRPYSTSGLWHWHWHWLWLWHWHWQYLLSLVLCYRVSQGLDPFSDSVLQSDQLLWKPVEWTNETVSRLISTALFSGFL